VFFSLRSLREKEQRKRCESSIEENRILLGQPQGLPVRFGVPTKIKSLGALCVIFPLRSLREKTRREAP
jgi:hypothetical protein